MRLKKEVVEKLVVALNVGISVEEYAVQNKKSPKYCKYLFAEVRRALKRGDIVVTPEVMEFFLRTSKNEAKKLDSQKV